MIEKNIKDKKIIEHLKTMPEDSREIFLLSDGKIRVCAINGTNMVAKMALYHNSGVLETYVLGSAYIGTALIASSVKGNDRIQMAVECAGPIGGIYTEGWASGEVRGYLKNNPIELNEPLEGWNLDRLYGPGFISITRILEGSKTPFTGQTMLQYGNLAKDLALYYAESEQTPTIFSISVNFDKSGQLLSAGGFFLQTMPGCSEDLLDALEEKIQNISSLGEELKKGVNIKDYIIDNFKLFDVKHLSTENVKFHCPCKRENYAWFLHKMPKSEQNDILKNGPFPLELECLNCSSKYSFSKEEITELFKD